MASEKQDAKNARASCIVVERGQGAGLVRPWRSVDEDSANQQPRDPTQHEGAEHALGKPARRGADP